MGERPCFKNIILKEHSNVLGIVAYKNNEKVYEEYFSESNENESIHNFSITADEFARIGLLCLNKGVYDSKRVISEEYLREMTKERNEDYGYLWWVYRKSKDIEIIGKPCNTGKYDSYSACGVGGSLIFVIPEKKNRNQHDVFTCL